MKKSMLNVLCLLPLLFCGSLQAKVCSTIDDLYLAEGCNISATKAYASATNGSIGQVNVKILKNTISARNPNKIVHIVGPYENTILGGSTGLDAIRYQVEQLRASGVDVAYYDFSSNPNDFLQKKSYALMGAMKKIDTLRGATKSSVMIGLSLGGVVARYALTTMEKEGYYHGVKYYVSFDSPHQGAHIPISLQRIPLFMKSAVEAAKSDNAEISRVLRVFDTFDLFKLQAVVAASNNLSNQTIAAVESMLSNSIKSPAVKQLLIQSIFNSNSRDPLASTLLSELSYLGYPKGLGLAIKNVAVVNGSTTGKNFQPSNRMYFNFYSNHVGNGAGIRELYVESYVMGASPYTVYSTPPGCYSSSCVDFSKTTYGHYIFKAGLQYKDVSDSVTGDGKDWYKEFFHLPPVSSSTAYAWDLTPCSTLPLPEFLASYVNPILTEVGLTGNGAFSALQKTSCFVPSNSALGKSSSSAAIPFHTYYGSSENNPHNLLMAGTLREGGNGNYFENDLFSKFVPDTYTTSANWSYVNAQPVAPTIYEYPMASDYACYMTWRSQVIKYQDGKCYVRAQ